MPSSATHPSPPPAGARRSSQAAHLQSCSGAHLGPFGSHARENSSASPAPLAHVLPPNGSPPMLSPPLLPLSLSPAWPRRAALPHALRSLARFPVPNVARARSGPALRSCSYHATCLTTGGGASCASLLGAARPLQSLLSPLPIPPHLAAHNGMATLAARPQRADGARKTWAPVAHTGLPLLHGPRGPPRGGGGGPRVWGRLSTVSWRLEGGPAV
jgi:hypothetical protein